MRRWENYTVSTKVKFIAIIISISLTLLGYFLHWALFSDDGIWHIWFLKSCGVQPSCEWCGKDLEEVFKDPIFGNFICRDCFETKFPNYN
jgi:hypothetical protein